MSRPCSTLCDTGRSTSRTGPAPSEQKERLEAAPAAHPAQWLPAVASILPVLQGSCQRKQPWQLRPQADYPRHRVGSVDSPLVFNEPTAKTGFIFLAERASSLKKCAEGVFNSVRYRLNEGSAAACIKIVMQFTGPRSGFNNRPGRFGQRPTTRRPADHSPENFPVSLWAKPENVPVHCGQSPKIFLVRYGLRNKMKPNRDRPY